MSGDVELAATIPFFRREDVSIRFLMTEQVRERETLDETFASRLEREKAG